MENLTIWLAIFGTAIGTFAMRISFLGSWSKGNFPPLLDRALRYAPPIIFAALITPMIVRAGADIPSTQLISRVAAAAATLAWALRFGGQVWPLVIGMLTLHSLRALLV
jgi:branched-subunit amino acid transport protein